MSFGFTVDRTINNRSTRAYARVNCSNRPASAECPGKQSSEQATEPLNMEFSKLAGLKCICQAGHI